MAVAMIWGSPGSGKTVAATAPKKEKILLLCSDNSSVVLNMFERKNVTVERVEHWIDQGDGKNYFAKQFETALSSGKYTLIAVDCLTDLKELALLEIEEQGRIKDIRQVYQTVYQALKRLLRMAANAKCHVIFTAWDDSEEVVKLDGTLGLRQFPNLPKKILPQVLGLCNIVGQMYKIKDKDGNTRWFLVTEDSETRYGCKDQLYGRKSVLPENIFEVPTDGKTT
jgi:phage nucleotide-binding protein